MKSEVDSVHFMYSPIISHEKDLKDSTQFSVETAHLDNVRFLFTGIIGAITENVETLINNFIEIASGNLQFLSPFHVAFESTLLEGTFSTVNDLMIIRNVLGEENHKNYEKFKTSLDVLANDVKLSSVGILKMPSLTTVNLIIKSTVNKKKQEQVYGESSSKKQEDEAIQNISMLCNRTLVVETKGGDKVMMFKRMRNIITDPILYGLYGLTMKTSTYLDFFRQRKRIKHGQHCESNVEDLIGFEAIEECNLGYNQSVNMDFITEAVEFCCSMSNKTETSLLKNMKRTCDYREFFTVNFLSNYTDEGSEDLLIEDIERLLSICEIYLTYLIIQHCIQEIQDSNKTLYELYKKHEEESRGSKKKVSLRIGSKRN